MPLTGNVRVKSIYLTVFVLLLTSYFLIFYALGKFTEQSKTVDHTDQVIYNIKALSSNVNQAESGARGYLLMNDSSQLEMFFGHTKQIDSLMKTIETLVEDNPIQQKYSDSLKTLVQERLGRLYRIILMFKKTGKEVAEEIQGMESSEKLMLEISSMIRKMENEERGLLVERTQRLEKVFTSIEIITITSVAIAFLLFVYSFFVYSRESFRKQQAGVQVDSYRGQLEKKIEELQLANKELQELRSIEKFAATGRVARTIAHEIRNPLTNISLASEQIRNIVEGNEEATMLLDMVNRNSHRINQMITELLSSTKFAQLDFTKTSIDKILDETIELASDRIGLKQIKVKKNYEQPSCFVMVDVQKIKIAFINIIMNAIEAMEESKGILEITTKRNGDKCVISFKDNGVGMSEETLHRIFEPYYTKKSKGNGLGLTNTENIILNHKGNIDVTSVQGEGTVFKVSLALER